MVNNAATVGRSGVHDFILLRASAVVLAAFVLFMAGFFITTPEVTYEIWHGLFANVCMKIFTMVAMFSLLAHAWIGIWQVLSDYVKATFLRASLQLIFSLALIAYFASSVMILWGV